MSGKEATPIKEKLNIETLNMDSTYDGADHGLFRAERIRGTRSLAV